MIKLSFVQGGLLRKVTINGKRVLFSSRETGFVPVAMDLDKIGNDKKFNKLKKEEKQMLKEVKNLNNEMEMANDVINDFKKGGWKLFKRE